MEPGPEKDALLAYLKHLASEQPAPTPYFGSQVKKDGEVFEVRVDWNYKRDRQGRVLGFLSLTGGVARSARSQGRWSIYRTTT